MRAASRATEPRPQHTARVKAQLTLRLQLRPIRSRRIRVSRRGFGLRTFLVGSSDRWTLVRRPIATAFSAADEEGESTSDVPCRRSRKRAETPFGTDQDRFHRRLVKGQRLLRPGAPSTDECSLGAAFTTPRTRARHPKFGLGRPTRASDALSPPANGRLDTAAFAGSSPASARRRAPLVDFCNQIRSQARPSDRRNSRLRGSPAAFTAEFSLPGPAALLRRSGTEESWVRGRRSWLSHASSPRRDCSRQRALPQPNRLGHLLSRTRGLRGWSGHDAFRARHRDELSPVSTRAPAFAGPGEGPPHESSREGEPLRCTRGAFHLRTSP